MIISARLSGTWCQNWRQIFCGRGTYMSSPVLRSPLDLGERWYSTAWWYWQNIHCKRINCCTVTQKEITHKAPSKKITLMIHFSRALMCNRQMTNNGIESVTMSSAISIAPAAAYMAYWFMVSSLLPRVQLPRIGYAWNRVVKKNVMNHSIATKQSVRAILTNIGNAKIRW